MVILGDAGGTEEISYWLVLLVAAGAIGWVAQRLHSRRRPARSGLDGGSRDLRARFIERQRIAHAGANTGRRDDRVRSTVSRDDATDRPVQA